MKKVHIFSALIIIFTFLVSTLYFFYQAKTYPIFKYFPLNENDKYIYNYHEGIVESVLNLEVKNVKELDNGKQFNFYWHGKDNNRMQTFFLTSRGLLFYRNEHLEGDPPLRAIRIYSPPVVMMPSNLQRQSFLTTEQLIYDCEVKGKLIGKEKIEALVSFVGKEEVSVRAGKFKCLHFFIRHNYKDALGNSIQMHTYDFWIAEGIGIIKMIHAFIPFRNIEYFKPEERPFSRYTTIFSEVSELKEAIIKGISIR